MLWNEKALDLFISLLSFGLELKVKSWERLKQGHIKTSYSQCSFGENAAQVANARKLVPWKKTVQL